MNLQNLNYLKDIITEQQSILKTILAIEKNKNSILVEGKLADFSDINLELNTVIQQMETIEHKRQSLMTDFIKNNVEEFPDSEITFSDLLKSIQESPEYSEMKNLYEEITDLVKKIKYWTAINKDLIEMALNVLNLTLFEDSKEIDYTGKTNNSTNNSMLINKII